MSCQCGHPAGSHALIMGDWTGCTHIGCDCEQYRGDEEEDELEEMIREIREEAS